MKVLGRLLILGVVVFALLQLVHPSIPATPAIAEVQAPVAVKQILQKDCYSCHSNERKLAWFDEIEPAYWLVRSDVLTAREHLNFSTLGAKPLAVQKATLFEAVNMIQLGAMPLPRFTQLHPEARVTPEELATLKAYLAPWSQTPASPAAAVAPAPVVAPIALAGVGPEFNGVPFDPGFENWKLMSTTDRGDNYTFRFILGNDIAVKAAQSGNISPWPDGSRFAKIAWAQEAGMDGLLHPGKFVQVELMEKDARKYKDAEGWGWGRWRGLDLKPYGKDAAFVTECTTCHLPVKGNDYVYTQPITAAQVSTAQAVREEVVNNPAAALPAGLPYQPLGWNVITMYVEPKTRTTTILFGNDAAMQSVHARGAVGDAKTTYGAGAVLALVTWSQRDDPHWFGARIPSAPVSVEFVEAGTNRYRKFAGSGLVTSDGSSASARTQFVLGLAPARLP
jgi:hypothetical protein